MAERFIFHIDVNSAFLSWEAVYRLTQLESNIDLREIPSAVGGDMSKRHGIILAKSIPAKKYGVHTGESIPEALRKCPDLTIVPPHYELYDQCSRAFMEILQEYAPIVEQASIDEAYCDVTETAELYGGAVELAHTIRNRIREELGFTVNIGVAPNKLLAKMASDFEKPDKVHTLFQKEISQKMWPLPVRNLFFVGRATERKLHTVGIHTIGELANTSETILKNHLKKHGETIYQYANGIDYSPVLAERPDAKGYGNSTTIAFDVTDSRTAHLVLLSLCESVGTRLRSDNVFASVVAVEIKNFDFNRGEHQLTLDNATNSTNIIHEAAVTLFEQLWDHKTPIRHLGVRVSRITKEETHQVTLFDYEKTEKLAKLDQAIDTIRQNYGVDAIMRASFLQNKIRHYTGGVPHDRKKPPEGYYKGRYQEEKS